MDFDWKRAVAKAQRHGSASSGTLAGFSNIRFLRDGALWKFQNVGGGPDTVGEWDKIPVRTIHFLGENATFTQLNSKDTYIIEELTQSIIRGDVKITGPYSCVNHLGASPPDDAPSISAPVPVPIKLRPGDVYYAHLDMVRVTRGAASWYIHKAHFEQETGSGGGRAQLETTRVYMCGGISAEPDLNRFPDEGPTVSAQLREEFKQCDSNHLVSAWVNHVVLMTTDGAIGAGILLEDSYDPDMGLLFGAAGHPRVTRRVSSVSSTCQQKYPQYACVSECGTYKFNVYSAEPLKTTCWIKRLLAVDPISNAYAWKTNGAISKCVRQLRINSIDDMAKLVNCNPLVLIAYLIRSNVGAVYIAGQNCYLLCDTEAEDKGCLVAKPMKRHILEGVTLLNVEGRDYSLSKGLPVCYVKNGELWHVQHGSSGELRVDPEAVLGALE